MTTSPDSERPPVDLDEHERDVRGFCGEFIYLPRWEADNGGPMVANVVAFDAGIYYIPEGAQFDERYPTDDGCALISDADRVIAEPIARILNRQPATVAELRAARARIAEMEARERELVVALRNCAALARAKQRNPDRPGGWDDVVRFCAGVGSTPTVLRDLERASMQVPTTVRDLTADPRFLAGTHAIRFTARDGAEAILRVARNATGGCRPGLACDPDPAGRHRGAPEMNWYAYDLDEPGELFDLADAFTARKDVRS